MEPQRIGKVSSHGPRSIDLKSGPSGSQEDVSLQPSGSADINPSASEDAPSSSEDLSTSEDFPASSSTEPRPTPSEEADELEEDKESLASSEPPSSSEALSSSEPPSSSESPSSSSKGLESSEPLPVPSATSKSYIEPSMSEPISSPSPTRPPGNGPIDEEPEPGSSSSPSSSSRSSSSPAQPSRTPPPGPGPAPSQEPSTSSNRSSSRPAEDGPGEFTQTSNKSDPEESLPTTTVSTTTQRGTTSLITSTTTDTMSPDSTFLEAVESTSTDPLNGNAAVVTPGFITEIHTSTEGDGSSTVVTRVIANPTDVFQTTERKPSGLLQNQGATAGVFTAVGFIVAGILFGIFWFCRRKRRHAQQKRWMRTLSVNLDDEARKHQTNPFTDPAYMRYSDHAAPIGSGAQGAMFDHQNTQHGMTSPVMAQRRGSVGPFENYPMSGPSGTRSMAIATTRDRDDNPFETASRAETSPSLYPASLPPENGEADSFYEVEMSSKDDHDQPKTPTNIQRPPIATEHSRRKVPPVYMPTPPGSAADSQDSPRQSPEHGMKNLESPIMFTMRSLNNRNST